MGIMKKEKSLTRRKFFIIAGIVSIASGLFRRLLKRKPEPDIADSISLHTAQFYRKL